MANGDVVKRWLRRSRLVAREYAFLERRDDCFSPATSSHVMNLLPMIYLKNCAERFECEGQTEEHILATIDVKDAFLCVPQEKPFAVKLAGRKYIIAKNLPGQRLGAKAWYWFFRNYLTTTFNYEWCTEQPCLCKNKDSVLMLHVDDVLFTGTKRSAVGGLLYLARDRPDLAFPVKELSSKMAQPTVTALQRLRKVMGYVKGTQEYAVVIGEPTPGQGDVTMCQIPTVWNAADLGTKALSTSRVRFLLHELGVFDGFGSVAIGEVEYNEQVERHGSRHQMMQLAKNLCRVFALLGLEPTRVASAKIVDQCGLSDDNSSHSTTVFFISVLVISWGIFAYFGWMMYKRLIQVDERSQIQSRGLEQIQHDHYHLSVQVAELDDGYGQQQNRLVRAEQSVGETSRDLEFVTDYASTLHFGLVELGGFRRYSELSAGQNRHMYQREAANLVSHRVMGGDRYMRLVSQQSTGIHARVENTDERNPNGAEESEAELEEDDPMELDVNTREHVINRLRALLNDCLAASEFADASVVQQMVISVLDAGQPGQALDAEVFFTLLENITQGLHVRFRRAQQHTMSPMADILAAYIEEFETQLGIR
eukprot:s313_g31.t1